VSGDWQAGDLALCIRDGLWLKFGVGPRCGQVSEVQDIYGPHEVLQIGSRENACFLQFAEWPRGSTFGSSNFRKIRPHTPDAEDRETIDLLNELKVGA
jgi:hypothetical protein